MLFIARILNIYLTPVYHKFKFNKIFFYNKTVNINNQEV